MIAPTNNLIVLPKRKWAKNISNILKIAQLENNSSVDANDVVTIVGEVISIPKKISTEYLGYNGFSTKDIQVGDTAIFSSTVINDTIVVEGKEDITFRNSIFYKAKEYFICDITKVFGVIRDLEIIMVNGWVMVEPFEESKIIVPLAIKRTKNAVKSKVIAIGNGRTYEKNITAKPNDTVYFNSMKTASYQINGKKFCVVHQNHILSREVQKTKEKTKPVFSEN